MPDDFLSAADSPVEEKREQEANPDDVNSWGGEGYPNAPEEVQNAMRELVFIAENENSLPRLEQIRQVLLNREFEAGRQIVYWSANEYRYKVPTADQLGLSDEEWADVQLTINIFTGYVRIIMAELSQTTPRTAFSPGHAKVQADVQLAKDSQNIVGYINRENRVTETMAERIRLLALDEAFGEYTRFVRDEKFGIEDYQVQEGEIEVELAPNRAVCAECGYQEPVELPEQAPAVCPAMVPSKTAGMPPEQCSAPMGPNSFQPRQTVMQPNIVTKQRPAGREVMDVVGMLEMVIPAYEKDEEELGFLTWCREVHKSKLMAIFPEAADKIESSGMMGSTTTGSNERIARLSLLSGYRNITDGQAALTTFRETWMRPWMYEGLRNKFGVSTVENFRKWFPDGFRVAFAGDVYCGSWAEALQDHWTICHAVPGEGQYRGAISRDAVPSQRQFNKCNSIKMETFERGLPFTIHDTDVVSGEMLTGRTEASAVYPAQGRGNKTVSNSVWQSAPLSVSNEMIGYEKELRGDIMQHQFGAFSALFGGDLGGNDTKGGIMIERNAAKGVQGLYYRALKNHRSRADLKNIRIFLKNRTQDVEIAVEGPGSEWDSVRIALGDIRSGNVSVKEDPDESFPISQNEQKNTVVSLFNNQNPEVMNWFSDIPNAVELVDLLGVSELIRVPGADAREKMFDIVNELLKAGPIVTPPMMSEPGSMMGGAPGGAMVDGLAPLPAPPPMPPEPSIQPDPVLDNLKVYAQTCQEWAAGPAGRKAQLENPNGYANVQAFAAKCLTLLQPPPMPMPLPIGGPPNGKKPLPESPDMGPSGPLPEMGIQ